MAKLVTAATCTMLSTVAAIAVAPTAAHAAVSGTASVYGVLDDGRLTYTAIDAATGNRTHGAITSTAALGFTPKAIATLNYNTLLITSTGGQLYRVDVITNNQVLNYNTPVALGTGWTHDLLTYDGTYLYGIAGGALRRYTIGAAKPTLASITNNTLIGTGFTLKTLTATGTGWLLGTTNAGALLSYRVRGANDWTRYELKSATWNSMIHLLSPGGGVYYGHTTDGALHRYLDTDPHDGNGADITGYPNDPVDPSGWTQTLISAQPNTISGTSSVAEKAISIALQQVAEGDPYVLGAEGPNAFDCSGLTWYAYKQAGYSWPRVAADGQYSYGTRYPRSNAKRGDLLFWSGDGTVSGIGHVAIYLGDNKIVEAANSTAGLRTRSITSGDFDDTIMPYVVRLAG